MSHSEDLERRLKRELKRKITIVESSRTRPTEAMIQERLRKYGDACFEAEETIQQARYEYANLLQDKSHVYNRRGGVYHYLVMMKQLHARHTEQKKELISTTELYKLANEWYEILVTVGEVEEMDRLQFFHSLNEQKFYEPSTPGDKEYPNPKEYRRSYDWIAVATMVRYRLYEFDALLEAEQKEIEDTESVTKRCAESEDAAMKEMTQAYGGMREKLGEFGRDLIVLMEKIEDVHESTTSHTGANVEIGKISRLVSKALGDHHEIFGILKKDHDGQREMRRHLELCTAESKNLLVQTKEILEELRRWRQEQSEANDLRLKDEQASKPFIDDCKERLRVIDRYLETEILRERRFADETSRGRDDMICVFCRTTRRHYSDACPEIRDISERKRIIEREGRCCICLNYHPKDAPCNKRTPCFYCKVGRTRYGNEHHSALCPKPDDQLRMVSERVELKKILEHYEKWKERRGIQEVGARSRETPNEEPHSSRRDDEKGHDRTRRRYQSDDESDESESSSTRGYRR